MPLHPIGLNVKIESFIIRELSLSGRNLEFKIYLTLSTMEIKQILPLNINGESQE